VGPGDLWEQSHSLRRGVVLAAVRGICSGGEEGGRAVVGGEGRGCGESESTGTKRHVSGSGTSGSYVSSLASLPDSGYIPCAGSGFLRGCRWAKACDSDQWATELYSLVGPIL
jgi:hypothetical protein